MRNYIVCYELTGEGPSVEAMERHLKRLSVISGRLLGNVWYLRYAGTTTQVAQHVGTLLGSQDHLLVIEALRSAWKNLLVTDESLRATWHGR